MTLQRGNRLQNGPAGEQSDLVERRDFAKQAKSIWNAGGKGDITQVADAAGLPGQRDPL